MYQAIKRIKTRANELAPVNDFVMYWRKFMPRVGGKKLYMLIKPKLEEHQIKLGRDGFFNYLRVNGLLVKPVKSFIKTTHSNHWMRTSPNLVKIYQPTSPEELFVSDITYLKSEQGIHYLSLVTDAYSRKIMGHELSNEMKTSDVSKALKLTLSNRMFSNPAVHHSDRGLQYCSYDYKEILSNNNIKSSMTDGYDCYQNALAERINGILKQEFLLYKCRNINELRKLVDESIKIYNDIRPHLSLNMKTPSQVHKKVQERKHLDFH